MNTQSFFRFLHKTNVQDVVKILVLFGYGMKSDFRDKKNLIV